MDKIGFLSVLAPLVFFISPSVGQTPSSKPLHDDLMPVRQPGPEFGADLKAETLNLGPMMDVAVEGDFIYAIGKGQLVVLSGAKQGRPVTIGKLTGLGNTRQITVSQGHAFVTAREDGLFIVDLHDPAKPKLVNHYDTAELATGIAVAGNLAAVANRFAGVELLDISQPAAPKHLSTVRVGEAQSLVFHGKWLYAGTWSEKVVAVIDIGNPRQPRFVRSVPLDGHGDGLDVRGNLLAAATRHHAGPKAKFAPGDAMFGHGHGVEFFDISNPAEPRRLAGLKFPAFYRLGMDTWGVQLAGDYAFVNDTFNGLFVIDVRDPSKPRCVAHHQLPIQSSSKDSSPATGLAVATDRVFVAGARDDLHLIKTGIHVPDSIEADVPLDIPPGVATVSDSQIPCYLVDGSIRSVWPWREDLLLVAAGSAGLHVVRVDSIGFKNLAEYSTRGFAHDVAVHGDRVYVAESLGGLSIWTVNADGSLQRTGAYEVPGKSIDQVVLADAGRLAFLAVGANTLHVVKLGPDDTVERILEETKIGLFYREPLSPLSVDGKRILVQWHATGLYEYRAEDGGVKPTGYRFPQAMGTGCGATVWQDGWLATSHRGFFLIVPNETRVPERIGLKQADGRALPGKPSCDGNTIFIADPFVGDVTAIDLADEKHPRLIAGIHLSGHPGRVRAFRGKAFIPAGRQGLLLWEYAKADN